MNSNIEELKKAVKHGIEGRNIGVKTGIAKMDSYLGGIQRKTYYLIFGLSGAGKTCYALYSFIYRPLMDNIDKNILIVYFSLEMSSNKLLSKLMSLYLFETYGVVVPYKTLMSWEGPLDDETYKYVQKGFEWLETIIDKLIIYDKKVDRDVFYRTMLNVFEERGTFVEAADGRRKIYVADDPDMLVIGVIDHVGLLFPKPGCSKKEEIDAVSSYAVTLRERCGASFVFLQQENRNSANMDRRKADMTECSSEDLKDTGNTFNDCEVCIGIYFPLKHRLKTCHKYPIINEDDTDFKGLRDRYRGLCLIKNRDGDSEQYVSTNFFGELGYFREMPKADEIDDYSPYLSLSKDIEDKDVVEEKTTPRKEIIYKF